MRRRTDGSCIRSYTTVDDSATASLAASFAPLGPLRTLRENVREPMDMDLVVGILILAVAALFVGIALHAAYHK